jgi:hypothetical protein
MDGWQMGLYILEGGGGSNRLIGERKKVKGERKVLRTED